MTTERDLIQRLADVLTNAIRIIHNEDGTQHISTAIPALAEARALLSQPEPEGPTDEELMALAVNVFDNPFNTDKDYARAVLARWGRPDIEAGLKESVKYDEDHCEDHWRKDALEKLIYAAQHFRLGVYSAKELEIFENRGRAVLANWGQAHD